MKINFLDTPGYFDFVGEVEEALNVADAAIIVVNGKAGVEVGTERAWELCEKYNLPRMIFVTGMDCANPSGYFNYVPPEDGNLVVTFHFYTPHSLTHQKTSTRIDNDPFVFYPGYASRMDWKLPPRPESRRWSPPPAR